jgi:hypothetical protein
MHLNRHMRKKECINTLNEILSFLLEHECFEVLRDHLNLDDQELEIVLSSDIIDIENDECKGR